MSSGRVDVVGSGCHCGRQGGIVSSGDEECRRVCFGRSTSGCVAPPFRRDYFGSGVLWGCNRSLGRDLFAIKGLVMADEAAAILASGVILMTATRLIRPSTGRTAGCDIT